MDKKTPRNEKGQAPTRTRDETVKRLEQKAREQRGGENKRKTERRAQTGPPRRPRVAERESRRWVKTVTTDSTHPPAGLFTEDAATIARTLASKKVSPKGPGSGMRMLTYFINRGGRGLSKPRRAELERAKKLLSERVKRARERG